VYLLWDPRRHSFSGALLLGFQEVLPADYYRKTPVSGLSGLRVNRTSDSITVGYPASVKKGEITTKGSIVQ